MKYILGIVLCLIVVTVYFVTRPEPVFEAGKETEVAMPAEPGENPVGQGPVAEDGNNQTSKQSDTRRAEMEAEFEKLEQARRNLESRLNRLKAIFWGVKIPREKYDAISKEMKNGYMLLKDKRLMGAYSDASEISSELSRVEFIDNYLAGVEEEYRSKRTE